MNRAERRRRGIKVSTPKMKHMTEDAYNKALDEARKNAVNKTFEKASSIAVVYMLGVPLLVLHDHFKEIMRKEWEGVPRIEHFFDLCINVFDELNTGENQLERLLDEVKEKTGFDISERVILGDK